MDGWMDGWIGNVDPLTSRGLRFFLLRKRGRRLLGNRSLTK